MNGVFWVRYSTYLLALFILQLAISYTHYLISAANEFIYYLFCYGCVAFIAGCILLYRWASVSAPADLERRITQNANAEKADQNSLKYGSLIMSSSVLVIVLSFLIPG